MKIKSTKQFRSYVVSWFLVIVGLIFTIGCFVIYQVAKNHLEKKFIEDKAYQILTISNLIDSQEHGKKRHKNLSNSLTKISTGNDVFSLNYNSINESFSPIIYSENFDHQFVEKNSSQLKTFIKNNNTKTTNSLIIEKPNDFYIFSIMSNPNSNYTGLLMMQVNKYSLNKIYGDIWHQLLLSFSLLLVLLMIASLFFASRITQPMEQLTQAIGRLISNDFNFKLSSKKFGRLSFLADQFNLMLSRIQTSRNELINLNKSYSRFIPHQLLKQLTNQGVNSISLGDCCERKMTILFCDIRGFTSLSETMSPQKNFKFINHYLNQIAPVINNHNGIIDKYIGDGIMALFPTCADDALKAAIEMLKSLDKYNQHFVQNKLPAVKLGLGLHTGMTMLGTVGTVSRMDATVIADTVNVASRVEAMTKAFSTKILMTEETKAELKNLNHYKMRYIANCRVPGKSKPVTMYEVFNNDPLSMQQDKLNNQSTMIKAWKIYKSGDKETAIELYQKLIEKTPEDKTLFSLIERCQSGRL